VWELLTVNILNNVIKTITFQGLDILRKIRNGVAQTVHFAFWDIKDSTVLHVILKMDFFKTMLGFAILVRITFG
jgi:hypothetical protein